VRGVNLKSVLGGDSCCVFGGGVAIAFVVW